MIRNATVEDACALATLASQTFHLACPLGTTTDDIQFFLEQHLSKAKFVEYALDNDYMVKVYDNATEILGYTLLVYQQPETDVVRETLQAARPVQLSKCYVHPNHHGSGIAGELLQASLEWGLKRGSDLMWLAVNQRNERAQRFYKKWGFSIVGEKFFQIGQATEKDYILTRDYR
ncbi:GNAT family N-acetyltransferase [Glutamicibacter uratoxydans]|uniref:GNAT family N-acetyltransferase n=1 Tax=Glutamicibacter uratoxydans TaxID=43667 RepID=UPI003D6EA25B